MRVGLADRSVVFRCDAPDGIAIAETVLAPYCAIGNGAGNHRRARDLEWLVVSAHPPKLSEVTSHVLELMRQLRVPAVPIRRWAGDCDADRYDLGDVSVIVHERPFMGLTIWLRARRALYYLRSAPHFDVPHTEHAIKYPLRVELRRAGFGQLHAAGCRFRDEGILLVGSKRAGKSTLAMALMASGARLVGNDMTYVRPTREGGSEMIAFPHMTRLADGTIQDNPRLRGILTPEKHSTDYLRAPVVNGGKSEFYFPVLAHLWGSEPICRTSRIGLVLFPRLDLHRTETRSVPLLPEEAAARIQRSLVTDPPYPDWLPVMTQRRFARLAKDAGDRLGPCLPPAYEFHFGAARTNPVHEIERLLAEHAAPGLGSTRLMTRQGVGHGGC